MDAKKILEKIPDSSETRKIRVSVSIDEKTFNEFKKICAKKPVSNVLEALVIEFLESAKDPKKK